MASVNSYQGFSTKFNAWFSNYVTNITNNEAAIISDSYTLHTTYLHGTGAIRQNENYI